MEKRLDALPVNKLVLGRRNYRIIKYFQESTSGRDVMIQMLVQGWKKNPLYLFSIIHICM